MSLNIENACECCRRCETQVCEDNCPMKLHIPELIGKIERLVARHINDTNKRVPGSRTGQ